MYDNLKNIGLEIQLSGRAPAQGLSFSTVPQNKINPSSVRANHHQSI